jgi:alanine transaminase
MALCAYPDLMNTDLFPHDAKERAQRLLSACGGQSVGEKTSSYKLNKIKVKLSEVKLNKNLLLNEMFFILRCLH